MVIRCGMSPNELSKLEMQFLHDFVRMRRNTKVGDCYNPAHAMATIFSNNQHNIENGIIKREIDVSVKFRETSWLDCDLRIKQSSKEILCQSFGVIRDRDGVYK